MRTINMITLFMVLPGLALAQDFTGTYTIPTSNGVITLTMNQNVQGQISGTLVGDNGLTFQVQGHVEDGAVQGAITNQNGGAGFGAAFEGDQLFVYLIPLDANNQPDEANAQQFLMQRQSGTASSPVPTSPMPGTTMNTNTSGLAGSYTGNIDGATATLTLQQQGTAIQGEANVGGYRYTLSGMASGQTAQGTFSDPQNGGAMQFELSLQANVLTLTLLARDPNSGQVQRIPMTFQRGGSAQHGMGVPGGTAGNAPGGMNGGNATGGTDNDERDPRLIGMWSHSDTMISGDYSAVSQVFMQVNPDGTYAYGNGRVMAGGSNAYGSVQGDTGYGNDATRGKWRTQGGIVYIMEPGYNQWTPYARYYVEGNKMMLTFGNGSKEIWYRQ